MTWKKSVYRPARSTQDKHKFAAKMRRAPSLPEAILWKHMRLVNWSGIRWTRQKVLLGYIADFFCSRFSLVVEIDGAQHGTPEAQRYDAIRNNAMKTAGYTVLRYSARDVFQRPAMVVEAIRKVFMQALVMCKSDAKRKPIK